MGEYLDSIDWLLSSDEPWTRYRSRLDLLEQTEVSEEVIQDRADLIADSMVQNLISTAQTWPGYPLKRHNDAKHPIQMLTVLADFGLNKTDPGMDQIIQAVMAHQSSDGAFETQLQLYKSFGGLDGEHWVWMGCDAPVLLYILTIFGLGNEFAVQSAKDHLLSLAGDIGWSCSVSPILGKFRGPGKKGDPCPIANLQALKALSMDPSLYFDQRVQNGIEMLLHHWEIQGEKKYYLFGIGTDFKKLKYPLIWYDLLHVADVLSRFPSVLEDPRFRRIVQGIVDQADDQGRYTASSMYMAWKGWSFADKKQPSPWLSFLVKRIQKRAGL